MLIVRMIREPGSPQESSNYEARVYINERRIWIGRVEGHHRDDGWAILLIKLARTAFLGPKYKQTEVRAVCCPACGRN